MPWAQGYARLYGTPAQSLADDLQALADHCQCELAVGEDGLKSALESNSDKPLVATFITAVSFNQILAQYSTNRHVSALFSEVDPRKNVALAQVLLATKRVSVFYSDRSTYLQENVPKNLLIKTNKESLSSTISRMDRSQVVVAVPDANIWTRDTFKVAVMSLYSQRKVVVGFSKNLVSAGALASFYFEESDYIQDLSNLLDTLKSTHYPSLRVYPETTQIAINQQVARSLDIVVADTATLLQEVAKAVSK